MKIDGKYSMADIAELIKQLAPLLAGKHSAVQGAALADLTAIWLAGHDFPGDPDATRKLRAELLSNHCSAIRELIGPNAEMLGTSR